jgi:hypothetical protein
MPRVKKTARVLERIELRVAGLKAIDPNINFGEDRSLDYMTELSQKRRSRIEEYNTALTTIDTARTEMADLEKKLNDVAEKMLIGVAFTYGKDSAQYEMAGGVKKSDRIRRSTTTRLKTIASKAPAKSVNRTKASAGKAPNPTV